MNQRRVDWIPGRRSLVLADGLIGLGSVLLAYALNPDLSLSWESRFEGQPDSYTLAGLYALSLVLSGSVVGLHDPLRQFHLLSLIPRTVAAVAVAVAGSLLVVYLFFLEVIGRSVALQMLVVAASGIILLRLLVARLGRRDRRRILLLIDESRRAEVQRLIAASRLPFDLLEVPGGDAPDPDRLLRFIAEREIDEVIVPWEESVGRFEAPWIGILNAGVQATHYPAFLERYFFKVDIDHLGVNWLSELDLRLTHPVYHRWKRLTDVALGLTGILLTLPLLAVVLLLIYLESGGPVFFRQERVGLRGVPFQIWKLRTLRVGESGELPVLVRPGDPRVTRVGWLLRRTRFDEVPQFWNILRGEMSLIGPRPDWAAIALHCRERIPAYRFRTLVKPGLTGWAQINHPYAETDADIREKLGYDFYYMRHASAMLDLQIVLRTLGVLMRGSR